MDKAEGAFLTIGELAQELGVPQHILRYWETRFPQLRPLQRAGNRRYYRPEDVLVARRIHRLLNVEGFTMKGAAKALAGASVEPERRHRDAATPDAPAAPTLLDRLMTIRQELAEALRAPRP